MNYSKSMANRDRNIEARTLRNNNQRVRRLEDQVYNGGSSLKDIVRAVQLNAQMIDNVRSNPQSIYQNTLILKRQQDDQSETVDEIIFLDANANQTYYDEPISGSNAIIKVNRYSTTSALNGNFFVITNDGRILIYSEKEKIAAVFNVDNTEDFLTLRNDSGVETITVNRIQGSISLTELTANVANITTIETDDLEVGENLTVNKFLFVGNDLYFTNTASAIRDVSTIQFNNGSSEDARVDTNGAGNATLHILDSTTNNGAVAVGSNDRYTIDGGVSFISRAGVFMDTTSNGTTGVINMCEDGSLKTKMGSRKLTFYGSDENTGIQMDGSDDLNLDIWDRNFGSPQFSQKIMNINPGNVTSFKPFIANSTSDLVDNVVVHPTGVDIDTEARDNETVSILVNGNMDVGSYECRPYDTSLIAIGATIGEKFYNNLNRLHVGDVGRENRPGIVNRTYLETANVSYAIAQDSGAQTHINTPTNSNIFMKVNDNSVLTVNGTTSYVGIGTETPEELLDVNGEVVIRDRLHLGEDYFSYSNRAISALYNLTVGEKKFFTLGKHDGVFFDQAEIAFYYAGEANVENYLQLGLYGIEGIKIYGSNVTQLIDNVSVNETMRFGNLTSDDSSGIVMRTLDDGTTGYMKIKSGPNASVSAILDASNEATPWQFNGNLTINSVCGIGTHHPKHKLHVSKSGSDSQVVLALEAPDIIEYHNAELLIGKDVSTDSGAYIAYKHHSSNDKYVRIATMNQEEAGSLIVTGNGHVGVGRIPVSKFEVGGAMKVTDTALIENKLTVGSNTVNTGADFYVDGTSEITGEANFSGTMKLTDNSIQLYESGNDQARTLINSNREIYFYSGDVNSGIRLSSANDGIFRINNWNNNETASDIMTASTTGITHKRATTMENDVLVNTRLTVSSNTVNTNKDFYVDGTSEITGDLAVGGTISSGAHSFTEVIIPKTGTSLTAQKLDQYRHYFYKHEDAGTNMYIEGYANGNVLRIGGNASDQNPLVSISSFEDQSSTDTNFKGFKVNNGDIVVSSGVLRVNGTGTRTENIYISYAQNGAALPNPSPSSASLDYSGKFESSVLAQSGFYVYSDERIKKNIRDIDDKQALEQLRLIKPSTYNYIDNVTHSDNTVIGFSAQQVAGVIPEAVDISNTEYIPSVFKQFECSLDSQRNKIIIQGNTTTNIELGDSLKLFADTNETVYGNVTNITDSTVEITPMTNDPINANVTGCFVYGKQVDDFHSLKKEYIFTVATAALQELDRDHEKTKQELQQTKQALSDVTARLVTLEAMMTNVTST